MSDDQLEPGMAEGLRRTADWLDGQVEPVTASEAMGTHAAPTRRRTLVTAAGTALLLLAVVGGYLASRADRDDQPVVTRTATSTTRPATTTTDGTAAGQLTTPLDQLPAWGFGRLSPSGLSLLGPDGKVIEGGLTLDSGPVTSGSTEGSRDAVLSSDWRIFANETGTAQLRLVPVSTPRPTGCPSTGPIGPTSGTRTRGGLRVAICGADAQEIDRIAGDGTTTVLSGPPSKTDGGRGTERGHWQTALPSPDGRSVAAEWAGSCEAPIAFIVRQGAAPVRVAGQEESMLLGWAPDGRVAVQYLEGECGITTPEPGIHLVDPTTGDDTFVAPLDVQTGSFLWSRGTANVRQDQLDDALRVAHLDAGGGDHTVGDEASASVTLLGSEVAVTAYGPSRIPPPLGAEATRAVIGLGATARAARFTYPDDHVALAIRCDDAQYWLTTRDDPAILVTLAEQFVPFLGCTPDTPPH